MAKFNLYYWLDRKSLVSVKNFYYFNLNGCHVLKLSITPPLLWSRAQWHTSCHLPVLCGLHVMEEGTVKHFPVYLSICLPACQSPDCLGVNIDLNAGLPFLPSTYIPPGSLPKRPPVCQSLCRWLAYLAGWLHTFMSVCLGADMSTAVCSSMWQSPFLQP